jgi:hypothetical protein
MIWERGGSKVDESREKSPDERVKCWVEGGRERKSGKKGGVAGIYSREGGFGRGSMMDELTSGPGSRGK